MILFDIALYELFFFFNYYLFLVVRGLCCFMGVVVGIGLLSSCSEWVFIAVASLDVEHWLGAHGLHQLQHIGSLVVNLCGLERRLNS